MRMHRPVHNYTFLLYTAAIERSTAIYSCNMSWQNSYCAIDSNSYSHLQHVLHEHNSHNRGSLKNITGQSPFSSCSCTVVSTLRLYLTIASAQALSMARSSSVFLLLQGVSFPQLSCVFPFVPAPARFHSAPLQKLMLDWPVAKTWFAKTASCWFIYIYIY